MHMAQEKTSCKEPARPLDLPPCRCYRPAAQALHVGRDHAGSPSQAPRAGRDRDHGSPSSPNCPSDVPEPSDNSD